MKKCCSFKYYMNIMVKKRGSVKMDYIILALGIAAAGYFIGKGLENFQHPEPGNTIDSFLDDDDDEILIPEKDIHYVIGVTKKDSEVLLQEYPEIPHIKLNGNVYYHKQEIKEWMKNLNKNNT